MEEITLESISSIITQTKFGLFICPICKTNLIEIKTIEFNKIHLKCPCKPNLISYPFNEFISWMVKQNRVNNKCFHHKETNAIIFCKKCDRYMCDTCKSYHSSFEPEHEINTTFTVPKTVCNWHKSQENLWFCKQCNLDICATCKAKSHSRHSNRVISMDEFYETCAKLLKFKTVDELNNYYLDRIEEMKAFKIKQLNTWNNLINQINNVKEHIIRECDSVAKENYLYMILSKMILDNFYNCNSIKISSIVKNVLNIFRDVNTTELPAMFELNSMSTSITMPSNTIGPSRNFMLSDQTKNAILAGEHPNTMRDTIENISKLTTFETMVNTFKMESDTFLNQKKIRFVTARHYSQVYRLYTQRYQWSLRIKPGLKFIRPFTIPQSNDNSFNYKILCVIEWKNGNIVWSCEDKNITVIEHTEYNNNILAVLIGHSTNVISWCEWENGNLLSGTTQNGVQGNCLDPIREWSMKRYECWRIICDFLCPILNIKLISSYTAYRGKVAIISRSSNTLTISDLSSTTTQTWVYFPGGNIIFSNVLLVIKHYWITTSEYSLHEHPIKIWIWDMESKRNIVTIEKGNRISSVCQYPSAEAKIVFNEGRNVIIYNIGEKAERVISFSNDILNNNGKNHRMIERVARYPTRGFIRRRNNRMNYWDNNFQGLNIWTNVVEVFNKKYILVAGVKSTLDLLNLETREKETTFSLISSDALTWQGNQYKYINQIEGIVKLSSHQFLIRCKNCLYILK